MNAMYRVIITGCGNPNWWYFDQIGETFLALEFGDANHLRTPDGKSFIAHEDCLIVDRIDEYIESDYGVRYVREDLARSGEF